MNQNKFKAWNNLNSLATMICKLEPWKEFSENDLLVINLPGRELPIYCVIMGKNISQVGVAVYHTNWGIWGLELSMKGYDAPENQTRRYNECLVMSVDVKENLTKEELDILAMLDFHVGEGQKLPKFTSFERKYWPGMLTTDEAEVLAEALFYLEKMISQYRNAKLSFDSENQMLSIDYNNETEKWETKAVPREFLYRPFDDVELKDRDMIHELKKKQKTTKIIEIDYALTKFALNKEGYKKAFVGRQFMMANHGSDKLIINKTIEPNDDEVQGILFAFTEYVKHFGTPKKIIIRDAYIESILRNTCEKLGVTLEVSPSLLTIDKAVDDMEKYFAEYEKA